MNLCPERLLKKWHLVLSLIAFITYMNSGVNASFPGAAYMRQWTGSALVQIMAWRLFDAKPLCEPMLVYYQLDLQEQNSVKFESKYKTFDSTKCIWKCCLQYGGHFAPGEMS